MPNAKRKLALEKVLPQPGSSFAIEKVVGPVLDCEYHAHPEYEITYVDGGHGTRLVGDDISFFEKGDLILIGGGIPHLYYNNPKDSHSETWARSLVVKFGRDCLGSAFFEIPEMGNVKKLLERSTRGLRFPKETSLRVRKSLAKLFDERAEARRLLLFLEILIVLSESKNSVALSKAPCERSLSQMESNRVERVLLWLHEHSQENVSLRKAASIAYLAPNSFSRFFHNATRKRFIDYLCELRIANAGKALLETDRTIAAIAVECGFRNLSNFNRQFLRIRKMTPKSYRKAASRSPNYTA